MVFRCRPKPNLAAAKKAPVSKPPVNCSEGEKQVASVKENVANEKKAPATPAGPPATSSAQKIESRALTPPPTATLTSVPSNSQSTPFRATSTPPSTPAISATPVPVPTDAVISTPSHSVHAVPRPPANITGGLDSSNSSRDDSESPLFIPRKPRVALQENSQTEVLPSKPPPVPQPLVWKTKSVRRTTFEPPIDLDEADNEDSEEEMPKTPSVVSRKRKTVDEIFADTRPKRKRILRHSAVVVGPLDRSKTTMRDLIHMHNAAKPPPQYRQERELKQFGAHGCIWFDAQAEKSDNKPVVPGSDDSTKDSKCSFASNSTSSPVDSAKVGLDDIGSTVEKKPKGPDKKPEIAKQGQAQFVMDADGNIVLNEDSLIIRRVYTDADYIDINQDSIMGSATYSSYRKQKPRSKKWTHKETLRLYKALSTVGTDFSIMKRLFKFRTREEIKRKFKREEKARPELIDHVLSKRKNFDLSLLDNPEEQTDEELLLPSDDSSSDSDDDALQKAVLQPDGPAPQKKDKKAKYRRLKGYERIDLDPALPANPTWFKSKTAYCPDDAPARKPKTKSSMACGVVSEALEALKRNRGQSLDCGPMPSPLAPAPSPCPSAPGTCGAGGGVVEDVLTRLIDQKMRDINQRPNTPLTSPPPPPRSAPLLTPAVRNQALSLTDFCKMETRADP